MPSDSNSAQGQGFESAKQRITAPLPQTTNRPLRPCVAGQAHRTKFQSVMGVTSVLNSVSRTGMERTCHTPLPQTTNRPLYLCVAEQSQRTKIQRRISVASVLNSVCRTGIEWTCHLSQYFCVDVPSVRSYYANSASHRNLVQMDYSDHDHVDAKDRLWLEGKDSRPGGRHSSR